jgi:autotransporter-associated beta strand protein
LTVGNNNQTSAFAGVIKNTAGTVALTKTGTNTLTLTGANTYTGSTVIANGTLALGTGGSISNSANINVASGAIFDVTVNGFVLGAAKTLLCNGTVNGLLTVNAGGTLGGSGHINNTVTLMAGNAAINLQNGAGETLTLNYGLNLANGNVLAFDLGASYDHLVLGGGMVTNSATATPVTINLTNIVGFAGGTFDLITGGSVTSTNGYVLGTVPAGYAGVLQTTGGTLQAVLTVAVTVNPNPTNITAAVSGKTLTLSWPADHLGWILQSQTNSLSVGLTTNNWFDVFGSGSSNTNIITINPANPTVFYRLRKP